MQLKLRHKLVLFVIIGAVTISLVGLFYVQRMQVLYEELVYQEASDKLNLYSERIEEKLNEIDKLTLTIASDPDIQKSLRLIKYEKESFETFKAINLLKQKLLMFPFHDYSIKSIVIVDANGSEYLAGSLADAPTPAHNKNMLNRAADKAGASLWMGGGEEPLTFISVRQIRAVQNMDLQPLGTLIIRVDPDEVVKRLNKKGKRYETSLLIQEVIKLVYSDTDHAKAVDLSYRSESQGGSVEQHSILSIEKRKYMATYSTLAYTGWTFIHLVSYESLFDRVVDMKLILLLSYGCILAALVWFGLIFSRSITRSLEDLTRSMTKVEKGDFAPNWSGSVKKMDEIGLLSNNFARMTDRLDRLIKENYIKQIHLKESQYEALKAKLNPHFLYNTLDSINWLARSNGQPAISKMVKALGDMLRGTISRKEIVTVQDEIDHLQNYFFIQKFRFENRLQYKIEIPHELHALYLPSMLLQPIVENCMKYGVDEETGECEIIISAERFGDRLDIWISDRGPGMDVGYLFDGNIQQAENHLDGGGIGLRSIHERIHLLYGADFGISIHKGMDQGAVIRISVPADTQRGITE